jgi:hypothetical protein
MITNRIRGLNTIFSRLASRVVTIVGCCLGLWKDNETWDDDCVWTEEVACDDIWYNNEIWDNNEIWPICD